MAKEIRVPDIGDFEDVEIIEVLVAAGDTVEPEQSLLTLESDKASMEVPAPEGGEIVELRVAVGDRVSEGDVIALLEASGEEASAPAEADADGGGEHAEDTAEGATAAGPSPGAGTGAAEGGQQQGPANEEGRTPADGGEEDTADSGTTPTAPPGYGGVERPDAPRGPRTPPVSFDASRVLPKAVPHASPAVRRFARELGVDLSEVKGTGRKGRIQKADVEGHVKGVMHGRGAPAAGASDGAGLGLIPWPDVDFTQFGEVEEKALSRIQKLSGANLARNWVMIPHVTQHDEADITAMEAFRRDHAEAAKAEGFKLTPLAFLIKAVVAALKKYPTFNASLQPGGETLVLKKYFHVGVAVDTPDGLVVPVIRDCERKSLYELAEEVVAASAKARDRKLSPDDLKGGCFTISSLGGIGGTAFTPIINAPEVAILGVSRSQTKPVWNRSEFEPRLMLPLSLSYDHRVIDGATAARFTSYLAHVLGDIRRLLL